MPDDHVRTLERIYEAWGRGDFRPGFELFDPHATLVIDSSIPDGGVYVGPEAIRGYMRVFLESWGRLTISARSVTAVGDSVHVAVHQEGTGDATGAAVETDYFQLWTFRGDRIVRLESILDEAEARAAAGLPEPHDNVAIWSGSIGRDAIIRAIFDAINGRDWDAVANLVDPEFEFYSAFAGMGESVYRGVDGVAELIAEFDETWDELRWTIEDVREAGELSLHTFIVSGRARGSGVPLDQRAWQVAEWRGRRPHRVTSYLDRAEALAAARLEG